MFFGISTGALCFLDGVCSISGGEADRRFRVAFSCFISVEEADCCPSITMSVEFCSCPLGEAGICFRAFFFAGPCSSSGEGDGDSRFRVIFSTEPFSSSGRGVNSPWVIFSTEVFFCSIGEEDMRFQKLLLAKPCSFSAREDFSVSSFSELSLASEVVVKNDCCNWVAGFSVTGTETFSICEQLVEF